MTAQLMTVKLSRGDNTPWGFRLQGGKDFSSPLAVQRVNPESLADKAGLIPGDAIIKILGCSTEFMKHKEAQDAIIRGGHNLELTVQRGGMRVWKPAVTPVGELPKHPQPQASPLTKTSLAANKQEVQNIGSRHNVSAKPFGGSDQVTALVHKQYNSPAGLYSMDNIADALSAHTEVLATGAKGINFMKEDQPVNKESAVYRMVHEADVPGKESPVPEPPVIKHVEVPITKPPSEKPEGVTNQSQCSDCGKQIIGVFVRIKDKSFHPECYRCSTCGTSLRNVGYYNVNDKLYCDIHGKQAARMMSTMPVYEPTTTALMQEAPACSPTPPAVSARTPPPAFLSQAPGTPPTSYGSISPVPFHKLSDIHHVEAPSSPQTMKTPPVFTKPTTTTHFSTLASPPYKASENGVTRNGYAEENKEPAPSTLPTIAKQNQMNSQIPLQQSTVIYSSQTSVSGGSKFIWPPPKTPPAQASFESNATPGIPTYRPPPFTQHIATPTTPKTPTSSTQPSFPQPAVSIQPSYVTSASKTPPSPAPKPHTPVQSSTAHGTPSWATTSAPTPSSIGISPGIGSRPAPRRGRGQMKSQVGPGARIPICSVCGSPIRGPFVTALGKTWCPDHFLCGNNRCRRPLQDIGFVEEQGQLYCENCYEVYLAPVCSKCSNRIKGDCLNALDKPWHPDCFVCAYCHKPFGNSSFYMEDGKPFCEKDWNELFTTRCVGCGYPIEAGDRWVEALNNNYHSQCFKCTICHKNLEGQSFYAKGGRPFCKAHAR